MNSSTGTPLDKLEASADAVPLHPNASQAMSSADSSSALRLEGLSQGMKFWTPAILAITCMTEVLLFSLGQPVTWMQLSGSHSFYWWCYVLGMVFGMPAAVFCIGGLKPPGWRFGPLAAVVVGVVFVTYAVAWQRSEEVTRLFVLLIGLAPLGLWFVAVVIFNAFFDRRPEAVSWSRTFLKFAFTMICLSFMTADGLSVNVIIHPRVYDFVVYRLEPAYGDLARVLTMAFYTSGPLVQAITESVYALLFTGFMAVFGIVIRRNAVQHLHAWRLLVVPFVAAWVFYSFVPIAGPAYAFGALYPGQMPELSAVPTVQTVIAPAYRNGMPSMHLTGAILIWILSMALRHRVAMVCSSMFVLGTAWATLSLAEHYVVDLIVALPIAAFLGTVLINADKLRGPRTLSWPLWGCAAIFACWLTLLRVAPEWLPQHLAFVQFLSLLTAAVSAPVYWQIARGELSLRSSVAIQSPVLPVQALVRAPRWIIGMFIASGFAGLMYEVVYAKALAITFGSTSLATYTVLATYMGGMALGAWLGGIVADRFSRPLRMYALAEAVIGIYAALTPQIFKFIQGLYVSIALDAPPDAGWLTTLRLTLGVVSLGIPTVLMGATFPFMFKHLRSIGVSSERAIAPLYASNVFGAAAGSLTAGYFILPAVGRNGGTFIAAIISLLVALYVLERLKHLRELPTVAAATEVGRDPTAGTGFEKPERKVGIVALAVLGIGGAVTLGLEVNSIHLLAVVAGNSVYAFGLMLSMFLLGLSLGSMAGKQLIEKNTRLQVMLWAQCGLALCVALTSLLWNSLPAYFGSFGVYPIPLSFSARETIRAMVCASAMIPPAFCIGMSYPAAMSLASDWLSSRAEARGLGLASGLNTLGNIAGVLLVGFWMLPAFGSRDTAFILGMVAVALATSVAFVQWPAIRAAGTRWRNAGLVAAAVAGLALIPSQWNLDELSNGANVYFSPQLWGKVVDHTESVEGGMTSVATSEGGVSTLLTNGKFQGNDAEGGEMVAQESFALFPLMHTAKRDSALVIGYGTGMTTRVLDDFKFQRVDVAELSRDIVYMADKHFEKINHGVSKRPHVFMHYTDGRNYLLTQQHRYDIISIEISSIWFAGAANLYNREFYALAKKRLTSDGILQQWVQLHHMRPVDLLYVMASVRAEFKNVWLYVRGGQGIIVANDGERALPADALTAFARDSTSKDEQLQPAHLKQSLLLSPAGTDNMISSFDPSFQLLASTDTNLYLEYATPKGNVLGQEGLAVNLQLLQRYEPASGQRQAP